MLLIKSISAAISNNNNKSFFWGQGLAWESFQNNPANIKQPYNTESPTKCNNVECCED